MLAYGRNCIIEALKSDFEIKEVFFQDGIKIDEKINLIQQLSKQRNISITYLPQRKLSQFLKTQEHQGVGANVQYIESKLREVLRKLTSPNSEDNSFIYISEATYEHNIGAIIRTSECAGLAGVIVPNDINITATIAKISTGALFHIPVIKLSIFQTIKELKDNAFNIVGIEREGTPLQDAKLTGNNLFIIGGEDKSLTKQIRELCDQIVEIPQFGKVNSLNMSVASGIMIYEYIRQMLQSKIN